MRGLIAGTCLLHLILLGAIPQAARGESYVSPLPGKYTKATKHFRVGYDDANLDGSLSLKLDATFEAVRNVCTRLDLPTQLQSPYLRVRIFSDWQSSSRDIALAGLERGARAALFSPRNNEVYFVTEPPFPLSDPDLREAYLRTVLQHEVAHQVLYAFGLFVPGARHPVWIVEGLACIFEVPMPCCENGVVPVSSLRLTDIEGPDELPFVKELLGEYRAWDGDPTASARRYAHAWSLVHFLLHKQPKGMKVYLETMSEKKVGEIISGKQSVAEFEAAFGPVDEVDKAWRAYVAELIAPSGRTEPQP